MPDEDRSELGHENLARMLVQALGRDVPVQVTGQSHAGDIRHAWADIDEIGRAWGFGPRVELREGLRRFGKWVREQPTPTDRVSRMEKEIRARNLSRVAPA